MKALEKGRLYDCLETVMPPRAENEEGNGKGR